MRRALSLLDRVGSIGALVAAIAAPCCFPVFAALGATLGLGAPGRYEGVVLYVFQGFVCVSLLGLGLAFRQHRRVGPLALGLVSAAALTYAFYISFSSSALYGGLFGLLAATLWNRFRLGARRLAEPILQSVITCPECGHRTEEMMPTNACVIFYDCPACQAQLKPKSGDCCVFCSYGSFPCPPIQSGARCCA